MENFKNSHSLEKKWERQETLKRSSLWYRLMSVVVLCFFLLPIFGFGKNETLTREKEGIRFYRYLIKEMDMLRHVSTENLLGYCIVIYYLAPLNYQKVLGGIIAMDDEEDQEAALERAVNFAVRAQKEEPSEKFLEKCEKKILQDVYADLGLS